METFKTVEELEVYNKKQIGLLNAKRIKDDPEAKYEEDYFKRITQNSQHHKVFNSDWSNYYTLELADTLLPYADGYKTKGTLVYDGAELFIESPKITQKVMSLSKDGKLISTAFFTYPKGVKIQQKKNALQIEHFETVIFAEVDKDNSIDIYLRFGQDFRQFLNDYFINKKLATTVSSVENKIYKTTVNDFKENFVDGMVHFSQMKFLLNLLDIKYDEVVVEHYFVNSWWTDENDLPIQEALLNDTVKFHIETKDISDNEIIFITLYDDDRRVNLDEDGKNDKLKLVYSSSGKEVIYAKVVKNKVSLTIKLENFESFLKKEPDSSLELFFACSYVHPKTKESVNKDLPHHIKNYLKVKGMPKIIFVNGQWRIAHFTIGEAVYVGPTKPKKEYWNPDFAKNTIDYLKSEFSIDKKRTLNNKFLSPQELEDRNYVLYYDGSSNVALDQSGADRFENGRKFAEDNFKDITAGLGNEAVYIVSHSEGGAYAAGMADYLFENGIEINEHILLSPDEGDEFEINPEIPSYQLLYMFFSSIYNPLGAIAKEIKFKTWGDYYAIVDWVVNEHKIKGITKMGIAHEQFTGWDGVHGSTMNLNVFEKISDLKEVVVSDTIGEHNGEFYSGKDQSQTTNNTRFYRIDDNYIVTNCPPLIEIK